MGLIRKQDKHLYNAQPSASRRPVTAAELRFMRQRIEGEPSRTALHDVVIEALWMLEGAVEMER